MLHARPSTGHEARQPRRFAIVSGNYPSACLIQVVFFAFFTHAITPPFAARLSDTEPKLGARSKTAPASPFCLFPTVTVFAFAEFSMHFAHGFAVSHEVKRAANGRVTDSGFKKKL